MASSKTLDFTDISQHTSPMTTEEKKPRASGAGRKRKPDGTTAVTRSISLSPALDAQIEAARESSGESLSAWFQRAAISLLTK
jgi:hypothetical protein